VIGTEHVSVLGGEAQAVIDVGIGAREGALQSTYPHIPQGTFPEQNLFDSRVLAIYICSHDAKFINERVRSVDDGHAAGTGVER